MHLENILFFILFPMTSFSEMSFGARLQRAQQLVEGLKGFSGYNPPRIEENVASLSNLLDDIAEANDKESNEEIVYKIAVKERQHAFRDGPNCIMELLSPIRSCVEAQYGKHSDHYKMIIEIINQMRTHRSLTSMPTNTGLSQEEDPISHSEQSYGSLHRAFADLVNMLDGFGTYNPDKQAIQVPTLEAQVAALDALHKKVGQKMQILHFQRSERLQLYNDLSQRIQRVKAYVKGTYGQESPEYTLIKSVEI
jgi:hypothetical protein